MYAWELAAWACWSAPIAGALLVPVAAKVSEKLRDYLAVASVGISALASLFLLPLLISVHEWPLRAVYEWVSVPLPRGSIDFGIGVLVDPLSIILAVVVSTISFSIMVYSLGYMHGDPGLTRYWFFMCLFVGDMLLLVLSDNLVQMLFGWEGVGLCSYALIGYWYEDSRRKWLIYWVGEEPEAYPPSHCGLKAFLMTRFGDVLMLAGAFIVASLTGTLSFTELSNAAGSVPTELRWLLPISLILILFGAIGKSAQLPLMEWLPDAMAGPTSVSALIHAATMVKAGVFLVARLFPIALAWTSLEPSVIAFFEAVAWIGALTAFVAATQALVSTELKKVLAYSTVSQIGYMMLALGAGGLAHEHAIGLAGGVLHLVSHAFFKAALFLTAGAVIHECGSRFLRHMGGLKSRMPITFYSMTIAALALMGVPPLSGFWSKDTVLEAALLSGATPIFALGVVTAALTAFYSLRMLGLVFFGEESEFLREREKRGHHVHEAPPVMWVPYVALVAVTIALGAVMPLTKHYVEELLSYNVPLASSHVPEGTSEAGAIMVAASSLAALALGAAPAVAMYVRRTVSPEPLVKGWLRALRYFLFRRYYINALYYKVAVEGTTRASVATFKYLETGCIDALNYALAKAVRAASSAFRKTHTGYLGHYVTAFMAGILTLLILLMLVP